MKVVFDNKKDGIIATVKDIKELDNVFKACDLLGKNVVRIYFCNTIYLDIDTLYYHRFEKKFLDNVYRSLTKYYSKSSNDVTLSFRNKRLYCSYYGKEVILPKDILDLHDLYSDIENRELTVYFELEDIL